MRRRTSENHSVRFWKNEEAIGGSMYILLPGIYTCKENAETAQPKGAHCRAVEYEQGYDEPQRVQSFELK